MSARPAPLIHRPRRTVPATLLGLALLALGAAGAWATGTLLLTGAWPARLGRVLPALGAVAAGDRSLLAAAAALALLGAVLLLAGLWPGRARRRAVLADAVPGTTALADADLARRVRARVERVDGVRSARVAVRGRTVRVGVRTVLEDPAPVADGARRAAVHAIEELRPVTVPRTRVRVRRAD